MLEETEREEWVCGGKMSTAGGCVLSTPHLLCSTVSSTPPNAPTARFSESDSVARRLPPSIAEAANEEVCSTIFVLVFLAWISVSSLFCSSLQGLCLRARRGGVDGCCEVRSALRCRVSLCAESDDARAGGGTVLVIYRSLDGKVVCLLRALQRFWKGTSSALPPKTNRVSTSFLGVRDGTLCLCGCVSVALWRLHRLLQSSRATFLRTCNYRGGECREAFECSPPYEKKNQSPRKRERKRERTRRPRG